MRICFDISAALGQGAGIGRYARELALALNTLPGGPELTLFHNRQPVERLPASLAHLPRVEVPLGNKAWRMFLLTRTRLPGAWSKSLSQCDLFHGTDALAPWLALPTVLTIHDLSTTLYPQHHTLLHRTFARVSLPHMARRASAIITDSAATRHDVIERLNVPEDKVHVVHLGVDHKRFFPRNQAQAQQEVQHQLGIKPPFVLAVGTLEPRKNLINLLRAYATLHVDSPPLVLVGARGWGNSPLFDIVRSLGLEQRVKFAGYVPDDILPNLYACAELFIYPSLYEGFGLPVLEALACGTPVITSNLSSLPEVAGDAALLVNPHRIEDLAHRMEETLINRELRATLSAVGPARAALFSWQRAAQETLAVYERVTELHSRPSLT